MSTVADIFALALQHHRAGNFRQAEELYQHVIRADPYHGPAHNNLGLAFANQGRSEEALAHYLEAVRLSPGLSDAYNNVATILVNQGKPAEAERYCRQALQLRPHFPEAYNNLGNALQDQLKLTAAVECYRRALSLFPNFAEGYYNLGNALRELKQLEEAARCFQEALRLKPQFPFALNNLGNVYLKLGSVDLALANFEQALRYQPNLGMAQSNRLFVLNYLPDADADVVFREHREWGQAVEGRGARGEGREGRHDASLHARPSSLAPRPLRIGYVSPDFRYHALTRYFEPVLARHDPKQIETFCYAEMVHGDAVTQRLQKLAHHWCWTTQLTDAQLAERIRADQIDILVDLAGHTACNRLRVFALKPAPIQATWLGYMNTTGLTAIDYRITDDYLDPAPASSHSSQTTGEGTSVRDTEELLRLPDGICCFAPPAEAPAVSPLPALSRGYVTFGSLHNLFKVNDRVLNLWSEVLTSLPTARFLMFRDTITAAVQERLRRQFAERGIAGERLDIRRGTDAPGFMSVYGEIDVSLDTFPFSGGVTTCESLWMGVPVISLCGVRPAGRHSAAILKRVDLDDWVADRPEQYVELAKRLSGNLESLAKTRIELRERMKPTLCDAERFTRGLEAAYRSIWRKKCVVDARLST
jgi:predicted O-linked N-acetylglucosamine transferase (SPINDLY family)